MVLKNNSHGDITEGKHFQFIYDLCGEGFNQKSQINRHMESSHPPSTPSAADLEKLLSN